jgi:hypothetical protein
MAHAGAAVDAAEAPLLSSSSAAATVQGTPRRNTFALFCATLFSMTTILMGYSSNTLVIVAAPSLYTF